MFCTQCGTQVLPDSKFCAKCGAALPEMPDILEIDKEEPTESDSVKPPKQSAPPLKRATIGPSGVGGWLMLLVATLTVLGPLLGAARIGANLAVSEFQYPDLVTLDAWPTYKTATWSTFVLFALISLSGGMGLARDRDWSAVVRAQIILWIIGPLSTLVMGVVIPAIVFDEYDFGDPEILGAIIGSLIGTSIGAGIWTAYLAKSKRVRNTYGGP